MKTSLNRTTPLKPTTGELSKHQFCLKSNTSTREGEGDETLSTAAQHRRLRKSGMTLKGVTPPTPKLHPASAPFLSFKTTILNHEFNIIVKVDVLRLTIFVDME